MQNTILRHSMMIENLANQNKVYQNQINELKSMADMLMRQNQQLSDRLAITEQAMIKIKRSFWKVFGTAITTAVRFLTVLIIQKMTA